MGVPRALFRCSQDTDSYSECRWSMFKSALSSGRFVLRFHKSYSGRERLVRSSVEGCAVVIEMSSLSPADTHRHAQTTLVHSRVEGRIAWIETTSRSL
ncbi:hypothetical protein EVAR_65162_1 [Eumeta japonica]|uniref:Uncharacterized protein n=1 Tax=Eumeta variegata TaxID=151549 RepID=A0A4C1ZN45_EUMVA|nr:hypothetical protein EVAR_65162_1 [Eumeta japonica]